MSLWWTSSRNPLPGCSLVDLLCIPPLRYPPSLMHPPPFPLDIRHVRIYIFNALLSVLPSILPAAECGERLDNGH